MRPSAFDLLHPAVALVYFVFLLVMDMAAMQPVYLATSFCAAVLYSVLLRGVRATLRTLAWQVPLIVLIALLNPLFSQMGSTEILHLASRAVYLESLVYGVCMGLMLSSTMLTFSNASHVLTSDKVMALLGNVVPTVGLMTCMTARLVPQFVRRGGEIDTVRRSCTAASRSAGVEEGRARGGGLRSRVRVLSVLVGWSLENSIETSDSMRCRGWGARGSGAHRSTYMRYRFRIFDGCAVALLLILAAWCAVTAWTACAQFQFYPAISGFAPWQSYLPYILYAALPLIAEAGERVRWSI